MQRPGPLMTPSVEVVTMIDPPSAISLWIYR
jgi:hypothetical protein